MNDLIFGLMIIVSAFGVLWYLAWFIELIDKNWCRMFGHTMPTGWCGGGPYLRQRSGAIDGIHRFHIQLYAECDKCDHQIHVGNIHHKTSKQFHPKRKDLWYLDEFTNDSDVNKQMLKEW